MKRVVLKEKSPEFEEKKPVFARVKPCDAPGCPQEATHRAPKDRGLSDYYQFCADHVSAYNQTWDFFEGMSEGDIEAHMRASMMGDRPTWRYSSAPDMEEKLRHKAYEWRSAGDEGEDDTDKEEKQHYTNTPTPASPEAQALERLGLYPPTTLEAIKKRYKELAKKHHPDRNPDNPDAEEILKDINMAYTVLKVAYEKYERLIQK